MRQTIRPKGFSTGTILLLLILVIGLTITPLFLIRDAEFSGADGAAEAAVLEISPETEPWFQPFWEPPGGETESLLFALQAALGAGVIGYFFGVKRGQRQASNRPPKQ
jgi:cobalt/nickel transport protein